MHLPDEIKLPPGLRTSFAWIRVRGNRAFISGHGGLAPDGSPADPFGKVPSEVSLEEAQRSARLAGVAMLASLRRSLGDLDRVTAWLMVNGMINADPGYPQTTNVMNGFSELILDLYGSEAGEHARTAIGVASVPLTMSHAATNAVLPGDLWARIEALLPTEPSTAHDGLPRAHRADR